MQKQVQFKTVGMQRDLSESAFNPKFAYENNNIRITPTDDNTLFSITNEKGNISLPIEGIGDYIEGTPIGQAIIDNEWIVFTTGDKDTIYKLWFKGDTLKSTILYSGNLEFSVEYPIETLTFYENNNIKKVYWVDGFNQPRVINIAATKDVISKWNDRSFDFVPSLELKEYVNIKRNLITNGAFAPGVIQYVFTYYNKYGQESNVFYSSPLYYISFNNRGASPEDKVSNSFDIEINGIDKSFDYLRIYSIHRTSIDATPEVKRVVDLSITSTTEIVSYTDNGTSGDFVDPTELLYVGGEEVIFGTLAQKDNTLFLGDFTLKRKLLDKDIRDYFKGKTILFSTLKKSLTSPEPNGYYPYNNQLKLNSQQIKTFKYLEYYRFGIQAQHYTGKWSEPIWINDVQNTEPISTTFYNDGDINLPVAECSLSSSTIINKLINQGYVKVRPVVVFPTINDREVICQGILCPTVYNVSDRYGNSPFAQSSWFTRPNIPFDIEKSKGDWAPMGQDEGEPTMYSKAGVIANALTVVSVEGSDKQFPIDTTNKGAWAEFRHNFPIPSNNERNSEIQCIWNPPANPYVASTSTDSDITSWVSKNAENFYIDQSILTFHSPDIEFDTEVRNLNTSGLKLRIVGMVPLTAFASDIDIQTSTPPNLFYKSTDSPMGFYKEPIGVENTFDIYKGITRYNFGNSYFGYRGLISGGFWFDELNYKENVEIKKAGKYSHGFVVYPWHRNGSLNNTKYAKDGYKSAMLSKKKISNLRFSYKTQYIKKDLIWNAYEEGDNNKTGISGVSIFDSNEISLIKVPRQANSGLSDINYYGNIDKVITVSRVGEKEDGYPIMTTGFQEEETNAHILFAGKYKQVNSDLTEEITGTDPVRMKYKSTPHAVLALNYTTNGEQRILPTIWDGYYDTNNWPINPIENIYIPKKAFWDKNNLAKVNQDYINTGIRGKISELGGLQHGWLWLGELYNDNVKNRFGGQTEEAFENNQWLPCGDAVSLIDEDNNPKSYLTIQWSEGDTYYQRYDHIKTYPFTLEDQNAVTDIISFMCETRVNIDGRYDRNRGQTSNLAITPENFNKLNEVYSQKNNFFNYRTINPNKLSLDNFHNSITWTKTKSLGELVDTWTNITLASVLDLDGDKGSVNAIRRLNNNLIAFQNKGISQILYNENMQIASTEGVPIEIANSGKVSGKRYITDQIGCTNKWSICETPYGIYFVDDISKGIYVFDGKVNNITSKLGFDSWIRKTSKIGLWNPRDFAGFITYYDKTNEDVLFIDNNECLAYSETLGQFTSFYNYESTPYLMNLDDKALTIHKDSEGKYKVWLQNGGDYNMFYGEYKPFYTTVIVNPDITKDKIFNNIEFRADSWNKEGTLTEDTFDTLKVWNEYQEGIADLTREFGRPSTLKKKFRIWRANIPRDKSNNRDRIRNPWAYLKLSKEKENTNKTILHDMVVSYFE
jgi:hypothetical protein